MNKSDSYDSKLSQARA